MLSGRVRQLHQSEADNVWLRVNARVHIQIKGDK